VWIGDLFWQEQTVAGYRVHRIVMRIRKHAGDAKARKRCERDGDLVLFQVLARDITPAILMDEGSTVLARCPFGNSPETHIALYSEKVGDGIGIGRSRSRLQHITPIFWVEIRSRPSVRQVTHRRRSGGRGYPTSVRNSRYLYRLRPA
jgi:hypothetical protein